MFLARASIDTRNASGAGWLGEHREVSGPLQELPAENKPHRGRASRQFDQTALLILPREQENEPVLQEQPNQLRVELDIRPRQGFVVRHSSIRPYCFHNL